MQGLVIIGALVMCSFFSTGSAIKCYHCAVIDFSVSTGRSICGNKDEMISTDCALAIKSKDILVQTKFGYLPAIFAKNIGLDVSKTVEVTKEDIKFKCAKMYFKSSKVQINGEEIDSLEATVHSCLADSVSTPSWAKCESLDDCYLCDENECNSSSGIASSLLLSIVLVAVAMIRF